MIYQIPEEPNTGQAVDSSNILWIRSGSGNYEPQACTNCGNVAGGPLSWADLVMQRGPLNDPEV